MNLFDASALLCYLQREAGADVVKRELVAGGSCSAANWSETAQKVMARGRSWSSAKALLATYPLTVEPVLIADAERAAQLYERGAGLSLADRLCIATAERLEAIIWTADTVWGESAVVRQVR